MNWILDEIQSEFVDKTKLQSKNNQIMKTKMIKLEVALFLLAILALTSCDVESDYDKQVKADDQKIQTFISDNNIDAVRHTSGIYYDVLEENPSGDAVKSGDIVSFYYKLSTLDSAFQEVIADSLNPVMTEISYNRIVPTGLYYGLSLMREGEKYRFILPSYLAYGDYSKSQFFGPHSIFIMDIEIANIQSKDDVNEMELDSIDSYIENSGLEDVEFLSSGLRYKVLEEGDGEQPSVNSTVKFHYLRKYLDGSGLVESDNDKPITARLNNDDMIDGLFEGISKMKEGEKAMLIMPSKLAFGSSLMVLPRGIWDDLIEDQVINTSVFPFSPVVFEIELLEIK